MPYIDRSPQPRDTRVATDMTRRYQYWIGHDEPPTPKPQVWLELCGDFDAPNTWRKWNGTMWVTCSREEVLRHYGHTK